MQLVVRSRQMAAFCTLLAGAVLAFPSAAQEPSLEFDPTVCAEFNDGSELGADCLTMIETFPRPPHIEEIAEDRYTLSTYNFWRVVGDPPVATFDGPNGGVNGEIAAGYNFVRGIDSSVEGWLQIEGGSWMQADQLLYVQPSYFNGVTIQDGLENPFAFVLDKSRIYVSQYPGGPRTTESGRWLDRYEIVNLYAEATDAEGWLWFMIGPNQWVEQRFLGRVEKVERPEGVSGRWVAVDLYEQTLVAYEDDLPVFATLISSGLEHFETNEGIFEVWARMPADRMAGAAGAPEAYALQSVPWVMYFDDSISLHGTYWHDLFGYRQSHGCVNLTVSDARWIFEWFNGATPNEDGSITSQVYVYSSGEYGVTQSGL